MLVAIRYAGQYGIFLSFNFFYDMASYPYEFVQDAVCQSHNGRMTGFWFLLKPAWWLNTNEWIYIYIYIYIYILNLIRYSHNQFQCFFQNISIKIKASLRKPTIKLVILVCLSLRPSANPHGVIRIPLEGFSWKFTFKNFIRIRGVNSM